MRFDSLLNLVAPGTALSLIGSDGVAIASTNIIDLTEFGSGTADGNITGVNASGVVVFQSDDGIGRYKPVFRTVIGTAATTGNAATLTIQLQAAPDNGSGSPGTYVTIEATAALTAAQLAANAVIDMEWPPVFPATLKPRFIRMLYAPAASTHFTAGTVAYTIVTMVRDNYSIAQTPKNYVVA